MSGCEKVTKALVACKRIRLPARYHSRHGQCNACALATSFQQQASVITWQMLYEVSVAPSLGSRPFGYTATENRCHLAKLDPGFRRSGGQLISRSIRGSVFPRRIPPRPCASIGSIRLGNCIRGGLRVGPVVAALDIDC